MLKLCSMLVDNSVILWPRLAILLDILAFLYVLDSKGKESPMLSSHSQGFYDRHLESHKG